MQDAEIRNLFEGPEDGHSESEESEGDGPVLESATIKKPRAKARLLQAQRSRPVQIPRSTKISGEAKSTCNCALFLVCSGIFLVVGLVAVLIYQKPSFPNIGASETDNAPNIFQKEVKQLKNDFPKIPDMSVKIINFTIMSVLNQDDPRSPAAILILGTKGQKSYTDEVLQKLIDIMSTTHRLAFNPEIQFFDFENDFNSQTNISEKLEVSFRTTKFMVLKNIDKAPYTVVPILHPFFDHENAPYKRVVYLCTATCDDELREESLKEYGRLARNHFDVVWEKYHTDHRDAMYSRLFTALVAI